MEDAKEYQISRINNLYSEMQSLFSDIHFKREYGSQEDMELQIEISEMENSFIDLTNTLYNICFAFLEMHNLAAFLRKFEQEMTPILKNSAEILDGKFHEDTAEVYSTVLHRFWTYLQAVPGFLMNYEVLLNKTGITYLEQILASTAVIAKDLGKTPQNEKEVYESVRVVCKATFTSATFPTDSFQKTAKCYRPDILIPSLNCAVEYKYAITEKELNETIDQILIDVAGYAGHPTYKLFYAVFYVTVGACTAGRFHEIWKEKGFPDNWKGILVAGL